jgi:nicotinate-nucleotide adenylyltransferase
VKTGIFGGTFDPPHIGHLIAAQDACTELQLDRIFFVPAGQPPHKVDQDVSPAAVRLQMLRAALADDDRFQVCDLEIQRMGPSFTVDTLDQLHVRYPSDDFFLLLGADQVKELRTWRQPERIAELAQIVLVSRAGVALVPELQMLVAKSIEVTRIDVSATRIRARVAAGHSIRYLVPPAVEAIIQERGLYLTPAYARNDHPRRG